MERDERGGPVQQSAKAAYPSLAGRVVLVTGGATGIGAAIVRGFVRNRALVAVLDIAREPGEALAAELGPDVHFLPCDLTDVAQIRAGVAEVESRLGPVRALVNNAANDQRHRLLEITPEQWDDSQAINVRQQFFVAQAVLPGMADAGGGTIVNLTSTAWRWGAAQLIPYTAAKAAVMGMTKSLGAAVGDRHVRVNAVAPGAVLTERQMRLWHTPESKADMVAKQAIQDDIVEDDVADAVLFLSADDSRMIVRQCITVDGGAR